MRTLRLMIIPLLLGAWACGGTATADVPAETSLALTLDRQLSTKSTSKGESFTATVAEPLRQGERVLVPSGATVHGSVTAVQEPSGERPAVLKLSFSKIEVRGQEKPIQAEVAETNPKTYRETHDAGKKVGGGAAVGALLGGILGDEADDAVVGAAIGAAAGTAVTLGTRHTHAYLPEGSRLTVRLTEPLHVPVEGEG